MLNTINLTDFFLNVQCELIIVIIKEVGRQKGYKKCIL